MSGAVWWKNVEKVTDIFRSKPIGRTVTVRGWIHRISRVGGVAFIGIRDGSGYIQISLKRSEKPELFKLVDKLNIEDVIAVRGIIVEDKRAPGGLEVRAHDLEIISKSGVWPITRSAVKSPGFLFDNRHLWIRSPKVRSVLKVRAEVCRLIREYMDMNGFIEFHAPIFVKSACEGGATLFPVDYFGDKVYLTQSAQLYQEAAIAAFGKVYTLGPCFRAEKSRTRKHLTEFWQVECEMAFADLEEDMKTLEDLSAYICRGIAERCEEELSILGVDFKPPTTPLPRITYTEALEIARGKGSETIWGEDFSSRDEALISSVFDKPFFVTHYPASTRSFYHMLDPYDPRVTLSFDLIAPEGYGELATGGQRISDYDTLLRRIAEQELRKETLSWYTELRMYGCPPHSGFGMGIERLVRWICRLPSVRMAIPFPRTPDRVEP
ncbi:MAG: asparagine--tRNA ligase [Nitrososphaerota archaeon]|nr:asparagine--tRNA ligase [Candidatus Bathyarchaeota archaeon]MDW8061791.1 asparagine--tRNA ligase [Nitrososphaerota archaeon]